MNQPTLRHKSFLPSVRQTLVRVAAFFPVLLLAAFIYWPGLSGNFIADDYPNLFGLKNISESPTLASFARYIFEGRASQLGRPLSLASFALQHDSWPDHPGAFKLINLLIHLSNGALVFAFALLIGSTTRASPVRANTVAMATATIWLLHPIQISTVLYVVQRMAQLSTFFVLSSVVLYVWGRRAAAEGKIKGGYYLMSIAVLLFFPLAVLSKENGVLLPGLILVIEMTLLATVARPPYWRGWCSIFLLTPILLLTLYFILNVNEVVLGGYIKRPFTFTERLLTEARVLFSYLDKFLLPLPTKFGLFYDDYVVSKGFLSPPTTAAAIAGVAVLLAASVIWNKTAPMFSFAVLWFLVGHALESSILPLELYFEHRNYLPLVGPALAAGYYLIELLTRIGSPIVRITTCIAGLLTLIFMTTTTFLEAKLWGEPVTQAAVWAQEKPRSKRAQDQYATVLLASGQVGEAKKIYLRIADLDPRDAAPYIIITELRCLDKSLDTPSIEEVLNKVRHSERRFFAAINSIRSILDLQEKGKCRHVPAAHVIDIITTLLKNNNFRRDRRSLYELLAKAHAVAGHQQEVLAAYENAYNVAAKMPTLISMIRYAAATSRYDAVLRYIDKARYDERISVRDRILYANTIDDFEKNLQSVRP